MNVKKELLDEETMLEALKAARLMEIAAREIAAREMAEMAFSIAYDTQKRVAEFRAEELEKHG